jgi:hypothetical protein
MDLWKTLIQITPAGDSRGNPKSLESCAVNITAPRRWADLGRECPFGASCEQLVGLVMGPAVKDNDKSEMTWEPEKQKGHLKCFLCF